MTDTHLWQPSDDMLKTCGLSQFASWLVEKHGVQDFNCDYVSIWQWSVDDLDGFWRKLMDYYSIAYDGDAESAFLGEDVENARWFEGVSLNYAEHIFRNATSNRPALISAGQFGEIKGISWKQLLAEVASFQKALTHAGVTEGDRVVAFITNTHHAIVGFLATAGLGAIWSSCSPDFGEDAVLDRFEQIKPKALLAVRNYGYGEKKIDRTPVITALADALPSLEIKILVDLLNPDDELEGWLSYNRLSPSTLDPVARRVPFGHPLWILFSSGTTGKPKAIVHSHGGSLLEHYKYLDLQADVRPGEHFFWFTTTGWMMWNFLQASMLVKAIPVLFDGSPGFPKLDSLWRLAAKLPVHHFGTSAPFIHTCLKANLDLKSYLDFSALRSIGSTGAPLSPDGFRYVYEQIKPDVWLTSMSGGTDVCTAFVGGNPWSPVYQGVIQGRALGCDLHAFNEDGQPVLNEVGELVVKQPMPSMPIQFWGDDTGERRHESYFEEFGGVWRHGDWITLDNHGGIVIHGRSDATLNRQGVRIGTAEIYRVIESFPEIEDSLIINYLGDGDEDHMPLFVKLKPGEVLSESLRKNISRSIREGNSPRHVPTRIEVVDDIPYTISGKKLEAPVKKLFIGFPLSKVAKLGALRNPEALEAFAELATQSAG